MTQRHEAPPAVGWQRAEGAGVALGGLMVAGFAAPGGPWWAWLAAALAPDIGMIGYLAGRRVGAVTYNLLHIYAVPFVLMMLGVGLGSTVLIAGGGLWLAHIGVDRAIGFGLKLSSGFRETHLGRLSRPENR